VEARGFGAEVEETGTLIFVPQVGQSNVDPARSSSRVNRAEQPGHIRIIAIGICLRNSTIVVSIVGIRFLAWDYFMVPWLVALCNFQPLSQNPQP
jgi:hypothetical protein